MLALPVWQIDPATIERQGMIGLLATFIVILMGVVGLLWRELAAMRCKYDQVLDDNHTCILQNTVALNALREQLAIYPTIQRLEDRLGDASANIRPIRK